MCDELDHAELDVDAGKFAAELFEAQQSLSERESELAEARAAIDALERQLIDGQNSMHAFAEERTLWHEQLSELESRLAEYALRIQELERQLDQVRTAQGRPRADGEANHLGCCWTVEPEAGRHCCRHGRAGAGNRIV